MYIKCVTITHLEILTFTRAMNQCYSKTRVAGIWDAQCKQEPREFLLAVLKWLGCYLTCLTLYVSTYVKHTNNR